jgi:hypothetical protein
VLLGQVVDAIFVIHYPKLKERKEKLENDLRGLGLLEAVTWVTWPLREDVAKMSREELCCVFDCKSLWFEYATEATKAVGLSHLWVYFTMYRLQLQHAIVMEDDPDLQPDFHLALRPAALRLPPNYTMAMLGGCMGLHACSDGPTVGTFESGGTEYRLFGPGLDARCSSGYMVSLHGAEGLLRHLFQKRVKLVVERSKLVQRQKQQRQEIENTRKNVDGAMKEAAQKELEELDAKHEAELRQFDSTQDLREVRTGIDGNSDWVMRSVVNADGYWIEPPLWSQSASGSRAVSGCRGVPWDVQACDRGLCAGACHRGGWSTKEELQCADICEKKDEPLQGYR